MEPVEICHIFFQNSCAQDYSTDEPLPKEVQTGMGKT